MQVEKILSIVYQKEDLIVIDKPSGYSVHSSRQVGDTQSYLLQMVRKHARKRVYPVHRLDKETSGIMIFTTDREKVSYYHDQLQSNKTKKNYLALTWGKVPDSGLIYRKIKNKKKKRYQNALTLYKRVEYFETTNSSLVEIEIQTGRSHQIRRHFRGLGHHILGDDLYGWEHTNRKIKEKTNLGRIFLHSHSLKLENGMSFSTKLPQELEIVLRQVR